MAPSAIDDSCLNGLDKTANPESSDQHSESLVPLHPLGVKPLGNRYLSDIVTARENTGTIQILPDELIAVALEYLDHPSLQTLGYTCRFLYAFCVGDELWKSLFLQSPLSQTTSSVKWRGSWRSTLLGLPGDSVARIDCSTVFSDVLHRPFVCQNVDLGRYAGTIPRGTQIKRFTDLSYSQFAESLSRTPFILTEPVRAWPAFQKWSVDYLEERYGNVEFRAEAVDWPFSLYRQYMNDSHDESPLYLFDRKFAEKMGLQVSSQAEGEYWKPDCFGPDLFELLGQQRPAHRWLIVGPKRSGSTFHKDPNGTSAWNAVLQGAKYWIMFPPTALVPGVYMSKDKSEVTSPLSIAEWLLEFHAEAREAPGCVEGVCRAGEILHVPSGWWHLVVNLEEGIALTQNFVPEAHLADVLSFLRDQPDQVTGFGRDVEDPYQLFVRELAASQPDLLHQTLKEHAQRQSRGKRKWDAAVIGESDHDPERSGSNGFSFGFGSDDIEVP